MVAIKDMEMPSSCYDCPFAKNERTNDYGSFCECGILEDGETINLLEHSKHPNCPLIEIQERKVGKWIVERDDYGELTSWHCSNCYDKTGFFTTCAWDYCPNCGADMRGSENG